MDDFAGPPSTIDAMASGMRSIPRQGPERSYSLVAFAHDLPPKNARTG
jgi:hypothetical protein